MDTWPSAKFLKENESGYVGRLVQKKKEDKNANKFIRSKPSLTPFFHMVQESTLAINKPTSGRKPSC